MLGFIIKNPNGSIIAIFADRGMAIIFCHQNQYPESWINYGEVEIKFK